LTSVETRSAITKINYEGGNDTALPSPLNFLWSVSS
jgi:hypothetical protein